MIVIYSKLIGLPIMELKTQTKLGNVEEIVFNKTNFKISGLVTKSSIIPFINKTTIVASSDLIEISNEALIAQNCDSVISLDESPRIKELIKGGYHGINQKVYTKSGKYIGKVHDLYLETSTFEVVKILVRNIITERLIGANQIIEVKGKKIYIKDDYEISRTKPSFAEAVI